MQKATLAVFVVSGLLAGCAAPEATPPVTPSAVERRAVETPDTAEEAALRPALERRVGDYVVHLVSGSFRKVPARVTERVIDREDGVWVMELELEDDHGSKTLRAWIDANGEVRKVARMTAKGEAPGTIAEYEALIASISLTPDENQGLTASTRGTCTVGPAELDCETKSYRVRLGDRDASLGITQSSAYPGQDVAGEITLADGTVIFRSELLERGHRAPADDSVAVLGEPPKSETK